MQKESNLSDIYYLRKYFTILGLTGYTGSGCTEVAELLTRGFDESLYPKPTLPKDHVEKMTSRKYKITYDFARNNFTPYVLIQYRHLFTWAILLHSFEDLIQFLSQEQMYNQLLEYFGNKMVTYDAEIEALIKIKSVYDHYAKLVGEITKQMLDQSPNSYDLLYNTFFSTDFEKFSVQFHDAFKITSFIKHYKLFQLISNNIRQNGNPYIIRVSKEKGQPVFIILPIYLIIL